MGKFIAILVACVILIGGMTLLSMNRTSVDLTNNSATQYYRAVAHSNAVSDANMAVSALLLGGSMAEYSKARLFDGFASLDTVRMADSSLKIVARGYASQGNADTVQVLINLRSATLTFNARAAVAAQCSLGTSEWIVIDGRDHDIGGNFQPLTGTLAISTMRGFRRQSQSKIGGTYLWWDFSPSTSYFSFLVEQRASWPGGFPDSPGEVLGISGTSDPDGVLKEIARSGAGGSQYVTNPANLRWPLRSLTYVELSPWGQWTNVDFQESSGILIVHNSGATTQLKWVKQGEFTGILIVDDLEAVDGQIIGCVVVLGLSTDRFTGQGSILFSRDSIRQALSAVQQQASKPSVVSWDE